MDLINTQLIESVFAGGGEMGGSMHAVDWTTTVLRPVEQWPQSLRTCVRIVLGSGHPMLISWGPEYTMLYNDAYCAAGVLQILPCLPPSCFEVRQNVISLPARVSLLNVFVCHNETNLQVIVNTMRIA